MTRALTTRGSAVAAAADRRAHSAARQHRGWLEPLGRAGYAAKGTVYLLVGVLALQAAFGRGGDITDTEGALLHILQAPTGALILALVAVGLAGYAIWCWLLAVLDSEHKGTRAAGIVERVGFAVTGVIYASLALTAVGLLLGTRSDVSGDKAAQDRTGWLMSQPFGPWLVAIVGLIVIGVGIAHIATGVTAGFRSSLQAHDDRIITVGRLGYIAHGAALGLVGVFLLVASMQSRPDEARGLGGALAALVEQPSGPLLLGALALGLAAYGVFSLAEARYRRLVVS